MLKTGRWWLQGLQWEPGLDGLVCSSVLGSLKYTDVRAASHGPGIKEAGEIGRGSHGLRIAAQRCENLSVMSACILAKKESLVQAFIFFIPQLLK